MLQELRSSRALEISSQGVFRTRLLAFRTFWVSEVAGAEIYQIAEAPQGAQLMIFLHDSELVFFQGWLP